MTAAGRALVAATLAAAALAAQAAGPARGLIVKLKDAPAHETAQSLRGAVPADPSRWRRVLDEAGIAPRALRPSGRAAQLLDFGHALSAAEAAALAEALRRRPEVEWVVPNERERRLQTVPNDPFFRDPRGTAFGQWWLYPASGSDQNALEDRLRGVPGFQSAWLMPGGTGVAGAVVAVLDTGITSHPELVDRVLPGYDFVSTAEYANDGDGRDADASDPGDWVSSADLSSSAFSGCTEEDSSWHGTIIAGQIAALTSNAVGVAAINWNGRVLPVRVAGKCGADVADIVDGMRWAAGLSVDGAPANPHPARVINISFGGSAACNAAYQEAIDELLSAKGAIVVAAAGNEHGTPTRPASCSNVVGVAALNRDGFKSSYSNFGPTLAVATVGGDPPDNAGWDGFVADNGLLMIGNAGTRSPGAPDYAYQAGTSFAAPLASGVASLMLSVNPALSGPQLIDGLRASTRPHVRSSSIGVCSDANPGRCLCTTSTCGAGILDAARALQVAQGMTPSALSPALIDNDDVRDAAGQGADRPPNPPRADDGANERGNGGGGALGFGWLGGLALAVLLLGRERRRRRG